jgi:hypothetical protein
VVADDERRAVLAEERVDLLAEPARMAKLEAVAPRRQTCERRGEPLVVPVEFSGSCQSTGPILGERTSGSIRS